jgi:hypothetical protein
MAKTELDNVMDFTAEDYTVEDWKLKGRQLAILRGELTDYSQWDFGDWLVEGQKFGHMTDEELKKHAESILKRSWKTLKNYKVVSNSFPKARRRDGLSYSLYVLLTKFNESDQEKALDRAEELQSQSKKPLSVRDFQKEMERLQKMDELPRDEGDTGAQGEENSSTDVKVKIELEISQASLDLMDQLSFARYGKHRAQDLVKEMLSKYWTDHKDELRAMLDANDPRLKEENPLP